MMVICKDLDTRLFIDEGHHDVVFTDNLSPIPVQSVVRTQHDIQNNDISQGMFTWYNCHKYHRTGPKPSTFVNLYI